MFHFWSWRRLCCGPVLFVATAVAFEHSSIGAEQRRPEVAHLVSVQAACANSTRQPPPWEPGGLFAGRRFWRASTGVRTAKMKARTALELSSPLAFEFSKGSIVGQVNNGCELVDGLLRAAVFEPPANKAADSSADNPEERAPLAGGTKAGWVTLTAEGKGGPKFFMEASTAEVEAASDKYGRERCDASSSEGVPGNRTKEAIDDSGGHAADILDLTSESFRTLFNVTGDGGAGGDDLWLVMTSTSRCKSCVAVTSLFRHLAADIAGSRVRLAKFDCSANPALCDDLDLLVHPAVGVQYKGQDADVHSAIVEWFQLGDGADEWLPANWSFVDTAGWRLTDLLNRLPGSFLAQNVSALAVPAVVPGVAQGCRAVDGHVRPGIADLEVGADSAWQAFDGGIRHIFADCFRALADSIDVAGIRFLTVRWLAAMQMWLGAMISRFPQRSSFDIEEFDNIVSGVASLAGFVNSELDLALARGGQYALCSGKWNARIQGLQQALRNSANNWSGSTCADAGRRAWTLLYSLAASSPRIRSTENTEDLFRGLWALIKASPSGPMARAIGGEAVAVSIAESISTGRYVDSRVTGAENIRSIDSVLLVWRWHQLALSRAAFDSSAGGAIPDLRWPSTFLCEGCWRKCFRRQRLCLDPWEDQRQALDMPMPTGFQDAMPNDQVLGDFLNARLNWTKMSETLA